MDPIQDQDQEPHDPVPPRHPDWLLLLLIIFLMLVAAAALGGNIYHFFTAVVPS